MSKHPAPPKEPCGTCPYRKDVPSGIWAPEEYKKLPEYDRPTPEQPFGLFMCHQRDGCLCGGWLMAHDRRHLLALRLTPVDESVWGYAPNTPCFSSGAEAAGHGLREVEDPPLEAERKIDGLKRLRGTGPFEVLSDWKGAIWVNGPDGMCLGRFKSVMGQVTVDVHKDSAGQIESGEECLDCFVLEDPAEAWGRFVHSLHHYHGVPPAQMEGQKPDYIQDS